MVSNRIPAGLTPSGIGQGGLQSPARSKHRQALPHVVHYAVVALFCLLFDLLLADRAGLALSSALFLVWSLWLVNREQKAALLTLNPIVCYQAFQAATLGLAPLYTAWSSASDGYVRFEMGNHLSLGVVAYGHALMVVGSWALYAGMKRYQPSEAQRPATGESCVSGTSLWIAIAIGVVFHWGNEVIMPYTGSTIVQLGYLPLAAFCMIALNPPRALRRSGNAQLVLLLLGAVGVLLLNLRRTSKMEVMFSFAPVIWWALKRKRRTTLAIAGLGLVVLYLGVVAPLVTLAREARSVSTLASGVTEGATDTMKASYSSDAGAYLQVQVEKFMYRLCDPSAAGMVVTLVQENGFLWGSGLDYVPASFIPRFLWRTKPLSDRGNNFTASIGGASDASVATSSTGQTSAGELYWNFGWFGVLIGMYALGAAISGFWWRAAGADPRRGLLEMTAYTSAMLSFVVGTGAAAGTTLVMAVGAGIFWRAAIFLRDNVINSKVRRAGGANPGFQFRYLRGHIGQYSGRGSRRNNCNSDSPEAAI